MTKKIPEGFQTITPTLIVDGAAKAIELYIKAFGAKELYRMEMPGTKKIMHAALQFGTSKLFISDIYPQMGAATTGSRFYLYFDDVDTIFKQARQAGLSEVSSVQDMFWGDRLGAVRDSFGNVWTIATHVRDVSPEEMEKAKKQFASKAA